MAEITAADLAKRFDVSVQMARRWMGKMPSGKKRGRAWVSDEAKAVAWVEKHALRQGAVKSIPAGAFAGEPAAPTAAPSIPPLEIADGESSSITELRVLARGLSVQLTTPKDGETTVEFDPRVYRAYKEVVAEIRHAERHHAEMSVRDGTLVSRAMHELALKTLARLVIDELDAWASTTPDHVLEVLTDLNVKCKARKTVRALADRLEDSVADLRGRIADKVVSAEDFQP